MHSTTAIRRTNEISLLKSDLQRLILIGNLLAFQASESGRRPPLASAWNGQVERMMRNSNLNAGAAQ